MLRNDLITLLSEQDNNAITVSLDGVQVDVDSVATQAGSIVLVLDRRSYATRSGTSATPGSASNSGTSLSGTPSRSVAERGPPWRWVPVWREDSRTR